MFFSPEINKQPQCYMSRYRQWLEHFITRVKLFSKDKGSLMISISHPSDVSVLWLEWENAVSMLPCSFLIESSSRLLITRTGIKARTSLISGQIRLLTLELLALEWRKFYTFELEYLWSKSANLDQILCIASLGWGKDCIRFWGRLDQNSGFHGNRKPPLTYNGENDVSTFSRLFFIRPFFILVGNEDMHKNSDKFEFRPDWTTDYGVSCPWGLKKPIDL